MGGIIKGIGNVGEDILRGAGTLVLGKKDPGQAAQTIDTGTPEQMALQKKMLGQYEGMLGQDYSGMASTQTAQQEAQARQNVQDQTQRAQQMVAQRGLGGTSMGMNAILGQQRGLGEQLGAIRAQQPMLEQQMRQQGLGFASKGIGDIIGQQQAGKIYQPAVASRGRQGGLAPLLGGAAGAMLGGSASAKIGMGLGQAATQIG